MKSPQHHWFYDELYLFNFRLVWPVTPKTLRRYIRDEFGNKVTFQPFGGKALKIEPARGPDIPCYVVALAKWNGTADCHAALSHECCHLAAMILSDRGVGYDAENDEAFTYFQSYLLRRCLNVLLPRKKRVEVCDEIKPKRR